MNVAARLETLTKILGRALIISSATHAKVSSSYAWTEVPEISLKGKQEPISVWVPSTP